MKPRRTKRKDLVPNICNRKRAAPTPCWPIMQTSLTSRVPAQELQSPLFSCLSSLLSSIIRMMTILLVMFNHRELKILLKMKDGTIVKRRPSLRGMMRCLRRWPNRPSNWTYITALWLRARMRRISAKGRRAIDTPNETNHIDDNLIFRKSWEI